MPDMPFTSDKSDSIVTHIRRHVDITIGCPICGKGYQNAASLWKQGRDTHNIQIVASVTPLQGTTDPEEVILILNLSSSKF